MASTRCAGRQSAPFWNRATSTHASTIGRGGLNLPLSERTGVTTKGCAALSRNGAAWLPARCCASHRRTRRRSRQIARLSAGILATHRDHGLRLKSSRHGQGALRLQHRTFDAAGLSHRRLGCGADLVENRIGEGSADALGLADGLPRAAYSRQMAMQGCIIHGDNMAEPDTSADFVHPEPEFCDGSADLLWADLDVGGGIDREAAGFPNQRAFNSFPLRQ